MEIEACAEGSLRFEVISRWPDQFDDAAWKTRAFSAYTDKVDIVKAAVLLSCQRTAEDFGLYLPDALAKELQSGVTLASTPQAVLVTIVDAVGAASPMPEDKRFAMVLRLGLEASWADKLNATKYWRQAKVSEYANDLGAVKGVVLSAISKVLSAGGLMLPPAESNHLSGEVTLEMRTQSIIDAMKASAQNAVPKVGKTDAAPL